MTLCIRSPTNPTSPPPSRTVQQLDPWGALLANTPTHRTPWCQNTEHSGFAKSAEQSQTKVVRTAQLCSQISTCLLAIRHVYSIRGTRGAKSCVCVWICYGHTAAEAVYQDIMTPSFSRTVQNMASDSKYKILFSSTKTVDFFGGFEILISFILQNWWVDTVQTTL